MSAKKTRNVYSLADERIIKPVYTLDEFKSLYSSVQDLNLKFYYIASLILVTKDIIEVYNSKEISLLVNSRFINKIASDYDFKDEYSDHDHRYLTGTQLKFIEYLKEAFLPFLFNEYKKLIPVLRKNINAVEFSKLTISNNLPTFNYNVRIIMLYVADVLMLFHLQINYLIQLKKRLMYDIISNPNSEFIEKHSEHILRIIDDTIMQIRFSKDRVPDFGGNDKSGVLPFLVNPDNTNPKEINPSASQIWTIKDEDKLICLGSETKLRKFIYLIQDYDIVEKLPEDDESQRKYLSLFLKSDYSNFYPNDPVLSNLHPVRLKVNESSVFVYLIGKLCKSEHNKKYLFDGTDNWYKVSKLFLTIDGEKLNNESMCTQYSRIRDKAILPQKYHKAQLIIPLVHATK